MRVRAADGGPIKDVYPEVQKIGGLPVVMPGGSGLTDASGFVEIGAPTGLLEVEAGNREEAGRGAVNVRAGEIVPLEIVLRPRSRSPEAGDGGHGSQILS